MVLADTHCHLDFNKFDADRPDVLVRALESGLTRILIPGLSLPACRDSVKLAKSHPMLYAAIGVHPTEALTWTESSYAELCRLAQSARKVVAVGEIGLDYYWDAAPHALQQRVLQEQLNLASELNLPVIIHLREKDDAQGGPCAEDALSILSKWVERLREVGSPLVERPGVLHSFSSDHQTAEKAISLGFYIGVTGPVTFKNARQRQEIIASLPLERLLIETDAPFLAPVPQRGRRNEPAFVAFIAEKIATLHSTTPSEVANITTANAARLFAWGG